MIASSLILRTRIPFVERVSDVTLHAETEIWVPLFVSAMTINDERLFSPPVLAPPPFLRYLSCLSISICPILRLPCVLLFLLLYPSFCELQ